MKKEFTYISPIQKSILQYISDHLNRFNFAPTQKEVAKALNIGRTSVEYHIKQLQIKGLVDKAEQGYRNIRVLSI